MWTTINYTIQQDIFITEIRFTYLYVIDKICMSGRSLSDIYKLLKLEASVCMSNKDRMRERSGVGCTKAG